MNSRKACNTTMSDKKHNRKLENAVSGLKKQLSNIYYREAVYHLNKVEISSGTQRKHLSFKQLTKSKMSVTKKTNCSCPSSVLALSKAFDSIEHQILLAKLQGIRASRPAIEWFGRYLTSRYQFVRINTTMSTKLPVSSGVPQGSILCPLPFLTSLLTTSLLYQKIVHHNVKSTIPNYSGHFHSTITTR